MVSVLGEVPGLGIGVNQFGDTSLLRLSRKQCYQLRASNLAKLFAIGRIYLDILMGAASSIIRERSGRFHVLE